MHASCLHVASVILSCPLALTKHRPACVFRVRVCVRCAIRRVVNMVREEKKDIILFIFLKEKKLMIGDGLVPLKIRMRGHIVFVPTA